MGLALVNVRDKRQHSLAGKDPLKSSDLWGKPEREGRSKQTDWFGSESIDHTVSRQQWNVCCTQSLHHHFGEGIIKNFMPNEPCKRNVEKEFQSGGFPSGQELIMTSKRKVWICWDEIGFVTCGTGISFKSFNKLTVQPHFMNQILSLSALHLIIRT